MNSNSLLTTVFRNFQCALKNRGYWPTTYLRAQHNSLIHHCSDTFSLCLKTAQEMDCGVWLLSDLTQ
jgi:hypothetical protein